MPVQTRSMMEKKGGVAATAAAAAAHRPMTRSQAWAALTVSEKEAVEALLALRLAVEVPGEGPTRPRRSCARYA